MSNGVIPDPATMFRDMLGQWEKLSNDVANQAMQSSEFGRAMNTMTTMSLSAQNAIAEHTAKVLMGMNLPSRTELLGVATQISALDERIGRIEAMLQALTGASPVPERPSLPRPPRTRKPAKA
jgi:hypothetical protein